VQAQGPRNEELWEGADPDQDREACSKVITRRTAEFR
jgi:hypothetical protein